MKEFVDLYAKLVIGTFSFIGPSFTLFISLFYKASEQAKLKHEERLRVLVTIADHNKQIKTLISNNEREIKLLNPKRQVVRLFGSLLISLFLICFYYFQKSHFWHWKYDGIRGWTLVISGAFFVYCLWVLWQVFCTIIQAKSEEEIEKNRIRATGLQTLIPQKI
jgi:hypothetical protein